MPRKKTGSSPDKPASTPARRNTRRARKTSEEAEETPVEIPRHLLRGSDESSEQSDNDSDYGSPKKGRGRAKGSGRGRKAKETPVEEKPAARPRRGRRGAAASATATESVEEQDTSTQETAETVDTTENEATEPIHEIVEPVREPQAEASPKPEPEPLTHEIPDEPQPQVSEVTIEQELEPNNDQAPVEEEEKAGSNKSEDGRDDVIEEASNEVVEIDGDSKDAPESVPESRSSSEKEVLETHHRQRSPSTSADLPDESNDKMETEEARPPSPPPKPKEPEPPVEKPAPQRKRKWTARKNDDQPVIAISTDSLKNIISEEVKPVPMSDVKLFNSSPEPEEKRPRTKSTADDKEAKKKLLKERLRKQEEEEERRNEQLVKAIDKVQAPSNGAASSNGTAAVLKDRKVSIIADVPPSPPKHESSCILYITNLVRPFTVLQLKGLLARTGKIVDEGFWIDKIKSKCFVKYEKEDEAIETRHALHGVTWPQSNPKSLNVDFGKQEDMDKAIETTIEMPRIQITTDNVTIKDEKEFGWSKDPTKSAALEDRSRSSRPVREWDVGKKDKEDFDREDRDRRRKRSSERENRREKETKREDRFESRRSVSALSEKHDADKPTARLLDDLFRKTKATPCIYWLPLSAEQIIEKEEQRQKNLAEHTRRMEEIRKQREERIRRRSPSRERRSRDRRRRSISRDRRYTRR